MANVAEALALYSDRLGMARESFSGKGSEEEVVMPKDLAAPSSEARSELERHMAAKPVSDAALTIQMHLKTVEERQAKELAEARQAKRDDYDIGWSTDAIPRNADIDCGFAADGMVCLKLENGGLRVAPTHEPSAAVNLEYLSLALKVRVQEGREPFFSLDPVNRHGPLADKDPAAWTQKKRFEPEWLAGTSAGEVMFQADYHLKEMSMGACDQPVVGMKSILDMIEREGFDKQWSGREWFVVRKAEIQISEDNVILPVCKMGVEAREQSVGSKGMEDSKLTRKDHPLVKYAEEFTKNFDLIAERQSVIYHLRELAKASIVAKYLVEAQIPLEEAWFNLAGEPNVNCAMEVPCATHDSVHMKMQLKDGKVVDTPTWNSVFGGVQFGIDRFSLSAPSAAMVTRAGRISAPLGAMSAARVSAPLAAMAHARISAPLGAMSAARVSAPLRAMSAARVSAPIGAMRAARGRPLASMARVSAPIAALSAATARAPLAWGASRLAAARPLTSTMSLAAGLERPQGVDLNLNQFDLTATHQAGLEVSMASWSGGVAMANAFWSSLTDSNSVFDAEDKSLLKAVFNPYLSDRREEGELFSPPDASFSHVKKLQSLTKSEEVVRSQRKEHFLSEKFTMHDAGCLFPISWRPEYELEGAAAMATSSLASIDFHGLDSIFALKSMSPMFDKTSEDGMRFRVYRIGSLEVRSTQEFDSDEQIGAAFSVASEMQKSSDLKKHIYAAVHNRL